MENLRFIESTLKMPLMPLPVRSSIVTVGKNEILISPGSAIKRFEYLPEFNITDIVAPNLFHGAGVPKAKKIYTDAKLWGAPQIDKKLKTIKWDYILSNTSWPFTSELPAIFLKGLPAINEVVFISKPSASLIVTDLCFNIRNSKGFGARLVQSLFGTYNKLGTSRLFSVCIRDKIAFEKSLGELFSHDFENIIVSHGENIIGNGNRLLEKALAERGYKPR